MTETTSRVAVIIDPSGAKSGATEVKRQFDGIEKAAKTSAKAVDQTNETIGKTGPKAKASALQLRTYEASLRIVKNAAIGAATAAGALAAVMATSAFKLQEELKRFEVGSDLLNASMGDVKRTAQDLAKTFATETTVQVNALGVAFKNGAENIDEAQTVLESANRLARITGGDLNQQVKSLSFAMNAFAESGLTAARAADTLFVGMAHGGATVEQLASSIGPLAPLAAQVGMSFQEMVAAVSALTANGQSADQATSGIADAIQSLIAPSSEAIKEFARLKAQAGLTFDFNIESARAMGFTRFIQRLSKASGGSAESMSKLFGSASSLTAILPLTTNAAEDFQQTLDRMGETAGIVQDKSEELEQTFNEKLGRAINDLKIIAEEVGDVLLTVLNPALDFLVNNIDTIAVAFSALIALNVAASILAIAKSFETATVAFELGRRSIIAFKTAMAFVGGPWVLAITAVVTAVYALSKSFETAEEKARKAAQAHAEWQRDVSNAISNAQSSMDAYVRSTDIDVEQIKAKYGDMADSVIENLNRIREAKLEAAADAMAESLKTAMKPVEDILRENREKIANDKAFLESHAFAKGADAPWRNEIEALEQLKDVVIQVGEETHRTQGVLSKLHVSRQVFDDFQNLMDILQGFIAERDWQHAFEAVKQLGDLLKDIPDGPLKEIIIETQKIGPELLKAKEAAEQLGQTDMSTGIKRAIADTGNLQKALEYVANYQAQIEAAHQKALEATRYQRIGNKENASSGLPDTPSTPSFGSGGGESAADRIKRITDAYRGLQDALDPTVAKTHEFEAAQQVLNDALSAGVIDNEEYLVWLDKLKSKYDEVGDKADENAKRIANFIGDQIGDAFMSIVDGTKTVEDAFRQMAYNVVRELYKILVVEQVVASVKKMMGFADGGVFAGGSIVASANGNVFDGGAVTAFANGGVVSTPTLFPIAGGRTGLMGEAGPEAIMPLKRGPDGKLGVRVNGQASGPTVNMNVNISAMGDGDIDRVLTRRMPQVQNAMLAALRDEQARGNR